MFVPPRFIVVDDKSQHLQAIVNSFQQLGTPCIGVQFKAEDPLNATLFRGVRVLFLDLHLLEGIAGTDNRRHFAQIAGILEDTINSSGGPFMLVVWTEHEHLGVQLREYLDEHLDPEKPHARPASILSLAKERFINTETGEVTSPAELKASLEAVIWANPQIAAMLTWESDILLAAADTLASVMSLVPAEQRSTEAFPDAIDTILSRLASEAVGRPHVAGDQRTAITKALAPILMDRVLNQDVQPETRQIWEQAVTKAARRLPEATPAEAGKINRMLHIAIPGAERIRATDWGALVDFPAAEWTDEGLRQLFGTTIAEILGEEFKIRPESRGLCTPCLVRIGAACDYAQKRRGPLKYLLGIEIPLSAARVVDESGAVRLSDSIWRSPVFVTNGAPFRLFVNTRFFRNAPPHLSENWTVRYRLREELLIHLISHDSSHGARPGIVQLVANE